MTTKISPSLSLRVGRYAERNDTMVRDSNSSIQLLQMDDWVAAVCNSDDTETVREILVRCAETMLPYWEARFDKDDSMPRLINAMHRFASTPTAETQIALKALIPLNRLPRKFPPHPGVFFEFSPEDIGSDCPADFAGDAVAYVALALVDSDSVTNSAHVGSALEASIEAIARLFAERESNDERSLQRREKPHS